MAQHIFKGPFHFSQLKSLQLKGKAGIYIWGFAYETDNGKLSQPVNLQNQNYENETSCIFKDEWKFIPYYVGLADKTDLFIRLTNHHAVRTNSSATKYVRFKKDYYKKFFNDPNYKIFTGDGYMQYRDLTKLVLSNPNALSYFNNLHLLYTINKQIKPICKTITDIPIINCHKGKHLIPDTLDEIVSTKSELNKNSKNNFWFCFTELSDGENSNVNMESQTYYSLKGKTVGKTKPYNPSGFGFAINAEASCKDIFKFNLKGDIVANNNFPGYI